MAQQDVPKQKQNQNKHCWPLEYSSYFVNVPYTQSEHRNIYVKILNYQNFIFCPNQQVKISKKYTCAGHSVSLELLKIHKYRIALMTKTKLMYCHSLQPLYSSKFLELKQRTRVQFHIKLEHSLKKEVILYCDKRTNLMRNKPLKLGV